MGLGRGLNLDEEGEALRQALYAALVTDTGQFSYGNTSGRVLRMAAELVEHGVDPETVWQNVYLNKSREELELEARARASLRAISTISAMAGTRLATSSRATSGGVSSATDELSQVRTK